MPSGGVGRPSNSGERFSPFAANSSSMSAGWNMPDCQPAMYLSESATEWSRVKLIISLVPQIANGDRGGDATCDLEHALHERLVVVEDLVDQADLEGPLRGHAGHRCRPTPGRRPRGSASAAAAACPTSAVMPMLISWMQKKASC